MTNDTTPKNICGQDDFKNLFFEHSRYLHNFIYFKCGDKSLAEDISQEAFLRLWKECKKVQKPKAKSFLFTVANNLFLDHVKHQKVVSRFRLQKTVQLSPESPEFLLEESEFKEQLEAAINALSEKQRTVFLMNRIEKVTYNEIAEILEISVKTVEKRMHKALIELRKLTKGI